ncbi:hypothetical protein HRR99_02950 [Agrobacterium vaccinii]|uniref:hypothetical protein n=1 Tax=Agrobacterium vaccinii TaxID=2735528 RepID=UPI001E46D792|nr:hypothetical protein [Agrobacterium vaccinii]UHS60551.1 hypothetical protein HRR99_02950 [Agrobacterium vaccinii]
MNEVPPAIRYGAGVLLGVLLLGLLLNGLGRVYFNIPKLTAFLIERLMKEARELQKFQGRPSRRWQLCEAFFWTLFGHFMWVYLLVVLVSMMVIAATYPVEKMWHLQLLAMGYFLLGCAVARFIRLNARKDWFRFRTLLKNGGEK